MRLFKIRLGISFLIAALLAGCTATPLYNETSNNISNVRGQVEASKIQNSNEAPVLTNKGVYVNPQPVKFSHTPKWMKKHVTIHGRGLPFHFYVDKILAGTNINVSYQPDLEQNRALSMNYTGDIKGALAKISAETGYTYRINDGDIYWSDMVSRTFDVSFIPGISQFLVGGQGTRSGNAANPNTAYFGNLGNSRNEYSTFRGDVSIWNDLTTTLDKLKSSQGKIVVSEASTSVTVYDHPRNVAMMASFIAKLNSELSREVSLQVRVLEINLSKNFNYGIDWNLVRKVMGVRVGLTGSVSQPVQLKPIGNNISSTAGFILNGLTNSKWAGTNFLINALKQQGNVSVVTEPRVVTLNNQVAEIGINTLTGYLKEVSVTFTGVNANVPTQSLVPGVVRTGFSLYILPKIEHGKVYLQISSDISNLENIQRISPSNNQDSRNASEIQVPTVNEKTFNQRSLVPSGATLIIAGFKQLRNEANNTKMFNLASGQGVNQNNTETIILITPTILR